MAVAEDPDKFEQHTGGEIPVQDAGQAAANDPDTMLLVNYAHGEGESGMETKAPHRFSVADLYPGDGSVPKSDALQDIMNVEMKRMEGLLGHFPDENETGADAGRGNERTVVHVVPVVGAAGDYKPGMPSSVDVYELNAPVLARTLADNEPTSPSHHSSSLSSVTDRSPADALDAVHDQSGRIVRPVSYAVVPGYSGSNSNNRSDTTTTSRSATTSASSSSITTVATDSNNNSTTTSSSSSSSTATTTASNNNSVATTSSRSTATMVAANISNSVNSSESSGLAEATTTASNSTVTAMPSALPSATTNSSSSNGRTNSLPQTPAPGNRSTEPVDASSTQAPTPTTTAAPGMSTSDPVTASTQQPYPLVKLIEVIHYEPELIVIANEQANATSKPLPSHHTIATTTASATPLPSVTSTNDVHLSHATSSSVQILSQSPDHTVDEMNNSSEAAAAASHPDNTLMDEQHNQSIDSTPGPTPPSSTGIEETHPSNGSPVQHYPNHPAVNEIGQKSDTIATAYLQDNTTVQKDSAVATDTPPDTTSASMPTNQYAHPSNGSPVQHYPNHPAVNEIGQNSDTIATAYLQGNASVQTDSAVATATQPETAPASMPTDQYPLHSSTTDGLEAQLHHYPHLKVIKDVRNDPQATGNADLQEWPTRQTMSPVTGGPVQNVGISPHGNVPQVPTAPPVHTAEQHVHDQPTVATGVGMTTAVSTSADTVFSAAKPEPATPLRFLVAYPIPKKHLSEVNTVVATPASAAAPSPSMVTSNGATRLAHTSLVVSQATASSVKNESNVSAAPSGTTLPPASEDVHTGADSSLDMQQAGADRSAMPTRQSIVDSYSRHADVTQSSMLSITSPSLATVDYAQAVGPHPPPPLAGENPAVTVQPADTGNSPGATPSTGTVGSSDVPPADMGKSADATPLPGTVGSSDVIAALPSSGGVEEQEVDHGNATIVIDPDMMNDTNTTDIEPQSIAELDQMTDTGMVAAEREAEAEETAEKIPHDWKPGDKRRSVFKGLASLRSAVAQFVAPYLPQRGGKRRKLSQDGKLGVKLLDKLGLRKIGEKLSEKLEEANSNDTSDGDTEPEQQQQLNQYSGEGTVIGAIDLRQPFPQRFAAQQAPDAARVPRQYTTQGLPSATGFGSPQQQGPAAARIHGVQQQQQQQQPQSVADKLSQLLMHPLVQQAIDSVLHPPSPGQVIPGAATTQDSMPKIYRDLLETGHVSGRILPQPVSHADTISSRRPDHRPPVGTAAGGDSNPYKFFPDSQRFRSYPQNAQRRLAQQQRVRGMAIAGRAPGRAALKRPGPGPHAWPAVSQSQSRHGQQLIQRQGSASSLLHGSGSSSRRNTVPAHRMPYHDLRHSVFDIPGTRWRNYDTRFNNLPVAHRLFAPVPGHRLSNFDRTPQMSERLGYMMHHRARSAVPSIVHQSPAVLQQHVIDAGHLQHQHRVADSLAADVQQRTLAAAVPRTAALGGGEAARQAQNTLTDGLQLGNEESLVQDALDTAMRDIPLDVLV